MQRNAGQGLHDESGNEPGGIATLARNEQRDGNENVWSGKDLRWAQDLAEKTMN